MKKKSIRLNPAWVNAPYACTLFDQHGKVFQNPFEPRYASPKDFPPVDKRIPQHEVTWEDGSVTFEP